MPNPIGEQIIQTYTKGISSKTAFNSAVDLASKYMNPTYETLCGDITNGEVIQPNTSAGIIAQRQLVAGLYSNTVSMGRGNLTSADPDKKDNELVKRFYGKVAEKVNGVVMSIFPPKYREMLEDYCLSSVGIVLAEYEPTTKEHHISVHSPYKCVWFTDAKGKPNKMFRGFSFTATQAVEEFGEEVSAQIKTAAKSEQKANEKFEFVHCVRPRKRRNAKRLDVLNMEFESIYVEVKTKKIVRTSGMRQFRYVIPVMFKRRGMDTGYSPALDSLPSMRTLVRGVDDYFDAVEKATNPPIILSDEDAIDSIDLEPGGVSYAKMDKGQPWTYAGNVNPAVLKDLLIDLREEVNKLHFIDLFATLEQFKTGQRTAYEVAQIIAEKLHMIAPVVHPLKDQCFAPLFEIVAEDIIKEKVDAGEDVPDILAGDEFLVKYTSRIDSKLNGVETENLLFAITEIVQAETQLQGGMYSANKMKLEEIIQRILETRNVDPKLYRSVDETEVEVDKAQQAIAQQQQEEAMANAAKPIDMQRKSEEGSPMTLITDAQRQLQGG